MGELLMLFITGGGSTAMGAILKGVFGYVFEARQQKHDIEMAREARANDNFLRLQAELVKAGTSESGCLRSAHVSSYVPFIPTQKSLQSQTQTEKGTMKSSSDSSNGKQLKSRSLFLLDTSALWDAQ
jgi:hypothetical protein